MKQEIDWGEMSYISKVTEQHIRTARCTMSNDLEDKKNVHAYPTVLRRIQLGLLFLNLATFITDYQYPLPEVLEELERGRKAIQDLLDGKVR